MIFLVLTSLMLIVGLVGIALGVAFLIVPDATGFARLLMLTSGSLLTSASIFALRARREATGFEDWLWTNRHEILGSGALYKDQCIRAQTRLTQFVLIVSFVHLTSRLNSRCYGWEQARPWFTALVFSLSTGIMGWWSTHGLVYTPLAIFKNLTLAYTKTAAERIAEITPQKLAEEEKYEALLQAQLRVHRQPPPAA
jgi:hypothetical protein